MQFNYEKTIKKRKELGELVTQKRKQKGLSREQLAEAVGCCKLQIDRIERGDSNFSFNLMIAVFDLLGLKVRLRIKQPVDQSKKA